MPPFIGGIVAGAFFVAGTIGYAVVATVVNIVVAVAMAYAIQALTPKPKRNLPNAANLIDDARLRTTMIKSSAEPRRIIYGRSLVSGPIVFSATTGTNNEYLHLIVALASHEVESIGDIYFDDTLATHIRYTNYARVNTHTGSVDQEVDADLHAEVTEWTEFCRLRGIAYVYVRLLWNSNLWLSGVPNVRALVTGKKVYDPRTGLTAWSENAALCQLDWLTSEYGIRAQSADVDYDSWIAAANICDEVIDLKDGNTQYRYTCNGTFLLDERPIDVMEDLLSASAGTVIWTQGKYRGYAGAWDIPTITLTDDDLRAEMTYTSKPPRRSLYNTVRGIFIDPKQYWQATDFPAKTRPDYVREDGAELVADIQLPFTVSPAAAQRIAKIHLERHRQSGSLIMPCKLTAIRVATWDTVYVTSETFGWTDKTFRVLSSTLTPDGGVDLTLQEETADVYTWTIGDETVLESDTISHLDPYAVDTPTGLIVASGKGIRIQVVSGEYAYPIRVWWDAMTDPFVLDGGGVQVEYKLSTETDWTYWGITAGTSTEVNVLPVVYSTSYDVRVRGRNVYGAVSNWLTITGHVTGNESYTSVGVLMDTAEADTTAAKRVRRVPTRIRATVTPTATLTGAKL